MSKAKNRPNDTTLMIAAVGLIAVVALLLSGNAYFSQARVSGQLDEAITTLERTQGSGAVAEGEFKDRVESAIEEIVAERQAEQAGEAGGEPDRGGNQPQQGAQEMSASIGDEGAVYGDPDAPVTLFVFADFNCPYCERFHPVVTDYVDQNPGEVNYVPLSYPVFGGNSQTMAQAAECIQYEVGAEEFFAFNDAAYGADTWQQAAKTAGVNPDQVESCVSERRYQDRIDENSAEGSNFGVTGTPSTLVRNNRAGEGSVLAGAVPVETLDAAIKEVSRYGAD